MSDKQLLTVAEVARVYGFSVQKVYRFIKKGELSKDSAGKISLSECLRVFGAIPSETGIKQPLNDTVKQTGDDVITLLKQQIAKLEKDLQDLKSESLERERQAIKERDRLFALLENLSAGAGVASGNSSPAGGLFGKLFGK